MTETALRFAFGENWQRYLRQIDGARIARAEASLAAMLGRPPLDGLTFLDIGCGSGLFSLAAHRLGARVRAFDYDPQSVAAAQALKARHAPEAGHWTIDQGSVLDAAFMARLGQFDVVYAWGVLHHTGALWPAVALAAGAVKPGGRFFLALYNDQGGASRRWRAVKVAYNRAPDDLRPVLAGAACAALWWKAFVRDTLRGRPFATWRAHGAERGMSPWRDVIDWVGGYPFEVARPEDVLDALRPKGFVLERMKTVLGGSGCNEFVFRRAVSDAETR